jgi:hypothetical protein
MLALSTILTVLVVVSEVHGRATPAKRDVDLLLDINVIKNYWGQVSYCPENPGPLDADSTVQTV